MEYKLTIEEQIDRLRNFYGVKFEMFSAEDANRYLRENTYYAKLRKYLCSFNSHKEEHRKNQRVCLDFSSLVEIAKLDMYLRKVVLAITLDLEHASKNFFIQLLTVNEEQDGYKLVKDFFYSQDKDKKIETSLLQASNSDYAKFSYDRFTAEPNIWNLIESLSFNSFIKLFDFYDVEGNYLIERQLLFITNKLRNAAAHNNALLHNLSADQTYIFSKSRPLGSKIQSLGIKNKTNSRLTSYPITNDLCAGIIMLKEWATDGVFKSRMKDLNSFMLMCKEKKGFFIPHIHLITLYRDFEKFLNAINDSFY